MKFPDRCPHANKLTLLAANELTALAAHRLRGHLENCPTCRAEWAALQAVWQEARRSGTVSPPADLYRRIQSSTLDAAPMRKKENQKMMYSFPFSWRSFAAVGAVSAAVAGVLLGPSLLHRPSATTAVAFARVEEAMSDIRTATWTDTTTLTDDSPVEFRQTVSSVGWAQLRPPRIAFQHFSATRGASPRPARHAEWRSVSDGQRMISFEYDRLGYYRNKVGKVYNGYELGQGGTPEQWVLNALLFPRAPALQGATTDKRYNAGIALKVVQTAWKSAPDTLKGEPALRFNRLVTHIYPTSRFYPEGKRTKTQITVWVDPVSYRIVRREETMPPVPGSSGYWKRVSDNYQYNVTPPVGTFELPKPPLHKPYHWLDFTPEGTQQQQATMLEQAQIRSVVQRAVAAWNRRDARAFSVLWDRGTHHATSEVLPNPVWAAKMRNRWKTRAAKGSPYKTWQVQEVRLRPQYNELRVRRSESEPFPPSRTVSRKYIATVTSRVTLTPGGKPILCKPTIGLRRVGQEFRITAMTLDTRPVATP